MYRTLTHRLQVWELIFYSHSCLTGMNGGTVVEYFSGTFPQRICPKNKIDSWNSFGRDYCRIFSNPPKDFQNIYSGKTLLKSFSHELTIFFSCLGGMITSSVYGIPVKRCSDPNVECQEHTFLVSEGSTTGRFLVDLIPALKYVPEWMPGAGFKTIAREWSFMVNKVISDMYTATLKGMV